MFNFKIVNSKFGSIVINVNDKFIGNSFLNNKYWGELDINITAKLIEYKCKGVINTLIIIASRKHTAVKLLLKSNCISRNHNRF